MHSCGSPTVRPEGGGELIQLTAGECAQLLAGSEVGRVVYTEGALPAVTPVNYAFHHGCVVIRTGAKSRLAARIPGTVVAFQVDDTDQTARNGWSVVVTGPCERVTRADRLAQVDALGLAPWASGDHPVVLEINAAIVTGVRLT